MQAEFNQWLVVVAFLGGALAFAYLLRSLAPKSIERCDLCDEPALIDGRCYDCATLCQKCKTEPVGRRGSPCLVCRGLYKPCAGHSSDVRKYDRARFRPPCCARAGEYNGFKSGVRIFECPARCSCHD